MNANAILKTFLSLIERTPLADAFPELKFFLQYETAPLTFPAIVATVSLTPHEDLAQNKTADWNAAFSLIVPADDFSSERHAELLEGISNFLAERLEYAGNLNVHADEIGANILFTTAPEWAGTDETTADADRRLTTVIRYTGTAQL